MGRAADGPRYFQTTQWSLVMRAGGADEQTQRQALIELLKRYMPALHSYLVYRKRFDTHRADDLLQGFLASKVVEHDLVADARREMGRFRSFLVTALNRYVISEIRREQAEKRGGGALATDGEFETAADAEPDSFDVEWARELLGQAVSRMRQECIGTGRNDVWEIFDARVIGPALQGREPMAYEQLVERFGLVSPAQASNLLITGRRSFVRVLRGLIAEYEPDDQRIDAELNDLQTVLSRS